MYTIQILNTENTVIKEQPVKPDGRDFFEKLFAPVGVIKCDVTIQFKPQVKEPKAVEEIELRLSPVAGKRWNEKVNIVDVYNELTQTQKQRLLLLAEYSTKQVHEMTGWPTDSIKNMRSRIYERIDVECRKQFHSRNDLKEFCKAVAAAGIVLIVWNPEME